MHRLKSAAIQETQQVVAAARQWRLAGGHALAARTCSQIRPPEGNVTNIVPRQSARGDAERLWFMACLRADRVDSDLASRASSCLLRGTRTFALRSGGGSRAHLRSAGTSPPANLLLPLPRQRAACFCCLAMHC